MMINDLDDFCFLNALNGLIAFVMINQDDLLALRYHKLITTDNADQMTETKKGKTSVRTAHSLNPVTFIIYDRDHNWVIREGHYGLANVAPTVVKMMGLTAPACWEQSMV